MFAEHVLKEPSEGIRLVKETKVPFILNSFKGICWNHLLLSISTILEVNHQIISKINDGDLPSIRAPTEFLKKNALRSSDYL